MCYLIIACVLGILCAQDSMRSSLTTYHRLAQLVANPKAWKTDSLRGCEIGFILLIDLRNYVLKKRDNIDLTSTMNIFYTLSNGWGSKFCLPLKFSMLILLQCGWSDLKRWDKLLAKAFTTISAPVDEVCLSVAMTTIFLSHIYWD